MPQKHFPLADLLKAEIEFDSLLHQVVCIHNWSLFPSLLHKRDERFDFLAEVNSGFCFGLLQRAVVRCELSDCLVFEVYWLLFVQRSDQLCITVADGLY